ncbi:DUF262 domain-containing protein [Fibrobacter sp. UWB5]|uniref:DUF262 domain-containing protein n=1 Tax=Fibrobacter sp. UWB5 TaxID=1964360 RepID=UPI000B521C69|nr:DUF262 domain-containing protein [Fibrobacter sp. UWB5]OWV14245.1 hypothetical protein B7989_01925 [Fibrobacter sp. UWB5]
MGNTNEWTLQEIANWSDVKIKIPAIQRGLVWKPWQIELLWDSILRGFPIGCFLLSENCDGTYDLMDGQQRFNAITCAFSPLKDDSQSELWIDIDPEVSETTRLFWIKVTTIAHPWGFENNDECKVLPASKRRNALEKFGKTPHFNIYHDNERDNLTLSESFPYMAKAPVPLHYMLDACKDSANEDDFAESIIIKIKESNRNFAKNKLVYDKEKIKIFYPIFKRIKQYRVYSNVINVLDKTDGRQEDASGLEILFNRLNRNGTQITADELKYSAIKAYWPEIRDINNDLAQGIMPPERLVLIIFKLVLTENSRSLKNEPTIKQIRELAGVDSIKNLVNCKYKHFKSYFEKINDWLGVDKTIDSTPIILRSRIINNSPDLFFLLVFMASNSVNTLPKETVRAFVFFIHFFVSNKLHKQIIEGYVQNSYSSNPETFERIFYTQIGNLVNKNFFIPSYKSGLRLDENSIQSSEKWFENTFSSHSAQQIFSLIKNNREILLFAQRRFLNKNFDMFLSTSGKAWEDHNVPWDYDHIVPQEWIASQRGGAIPFCKQWLNTIGNLAAIPFEVNRSKSNNGCWDFYENNADELFFDKGFAEQQIRKNNLKQESCAVKFANFSLQRMQKIYEQLDNVLNPIDFNKVLWDDNYIVNRKKFFDEIEKCSKEPASKSFFNGESDVQILHPLDWCRHWISIGYKINNKYFIAMTSQGEALDMEIGVRKINREDSEKLNVTGALKDYTVYDNNPYWFICKNIPADTIVEIIVKELEMLRKFVLDHLS